MSRAPALPSLKNLKPSLAMIITIIIVISIAKCKQNEKYCISIIIISAFIAILIVIIFIVIATSIIIVSFITSVIIIKVIIMTIPKVIIMSFMLQYFPEVFLTRRDSQFHAAATADASVMHPRLFLSRFHVCLFFLLFCLAVCLFVCLYICSYRQCICVALLTLFVKIPCLLVQLFLLLLLFFGLTRFNIADT